MKNKINYLLSFGIILIGVFCFLSCVFLVLSQASNELFNNPILIIILGYFSIIIFFIGIRMQYLYKKKKKSSFN